MPKVTCSIAAFCVLAAGSAGGQDMRDHVRIRPRGTVVTTAQASDLTLTLGEAAPRLVQTLARTAGSIDAARKTITAYLDAAAGAPIKVGQRARAFAPEARSSMYQGKVTRVAADGGRVQVQVTLAANGLEGRTRYVLEIVAEQGPFLSVPNEAIIEEGAAHVVYLQRDGQYEPQEIKTGLQGELFTQVLSGISEGDHVVTFGSFFIDSEYKLKGTTQGAQ
jgi:hypothetical protein